MMTDRVNVATPRLTRDSCTMTPLTAHTTLCRSAYARNCTGVPRGGTSLRSFFVLLARHEKSGVDGGSIFGGVRFVNASQGESRAKKNEKNFFRKRLKHGKQRRWARRRASTKSKSKDSRRSFYCLEMLPYPSGADPIMGHRAENYTDRRCRLPVYSAELNGRNVHPSGGWAWDAFGMRPENAAIKQQRAA
jgi:hypothetical protein